MEVYYARIISVCGFQREQTRMLAWRQAGSHRNEKENTCRLMFNPERSACCSRSDSQALEFRSRIGALVALLVLMPLLVVALTPLNKRLLAWRKARGRDIEEEEKYEREGAGIISIRPKSQAEIEEDERRHLHPSLR